jgi:mono/diheme cytochrome c family protein
VTLLDTRRLLLAALLAAAPLANASADEDFAPFPPGENAALVKKTCTECHGANVVLSAQFDEKLARKQYKLFVGDPDSEDGKKVVKYLTTVLGPR